MREGVIFTMEEVKRYGVIKALLEGKMSNEEAALALGICVRQIQRLKQEVAQLGVEGVRHGNLGRLPANVFSSEFRQQVIELAQSRYYDFNFSHLSEMLAGREGINVSRETLRFWLRPLGFGGKVRRVPIHRKRRKRSEKSGQMLFLDGSPHLWFGTQPCTLILCTDDATGEPLYGLFQAEEDLDGCFKVCLAVFGKYGLPVCFYLDRASQFTTTRHGGLHVAQSDQNPTQFERAMQELGIGLIFAHSPQARGRGERINGTFQDRLVAELRLHGINNTEAANVYMNKTFIPGYAQRFSVAPEDTLTAFRPVPSNLELRDVLCKRFQRTVKNDNTISVNNQTIQLLPLPNRLHFVRAKVLVNLWVDEAWHVFHPEAGAIPCQLLPETKTQNINLSQNGNYKHQANFKAINM